MPVPTGKDKVKEDIKTFAIVPEDMYTVEVADITYHEGVEGKYGKKDKYYFRMGILDDNEFDFKDGKETKKENTRGMLLMAFTTTAYSQGSRGYSNSKLYDVACALMGETLDPKEELSVNSLIGKRCRVAVKHSEGDDRTYVNIDTFMKENASSSKLKGLTEKEIEALMPKNDEDYQDEDTITDEDLDSISKEIDKDPSKTFDGKLPE